MLFSTCFIATIWALRPVVCRGPLVDLDSEIKAAVESCGHQPGFGVAMMSRNGSAGDFTYANGFGFRDMERGLKADGNTMWCMGSVSKHLAATLLVHLLDLLQTSGHPSLYSLRTLITELDPTLSFAGSQLINVTLEDILSMRTGLADYFGSLQTGFPPKFKPRDIAQVAAKLPRLAPLREHYIYNNHVYALVGHASEILGTIYHKRNVTWEELTRIHFWDRLNVSQDVSFASPDSGYAQRVSEPYTTIGGQFRRVSHLVAETVKPMASAGGICLTPKAMTAWMELLLNRGVYKGGVVIQPAVFDDTWTPRIKQDEASDQEHYALGWMTNEYQPGTHILQHTGGISTYVSFFIVYPEWKYALFVSSAGGYLINQAGTIGKVVEIFARAVNITTPVVPYTNIKCGQIPLASPNNVTDPVVPIEKSFYIGTYSHPHFGNLELKDEENKLKMKLGEIGHAEIQCYHSGPCRLKFEEPLYLLTAADPEGLINDTIEFGKNSSGYVTSVTMPFYGEPMTPSFTRCAPAEQTPSQPGNSGTVDQFVVHNVILWIAAVTLWMYRASISTS